MIMPPKRWINIMCLLQIVKDSETEKNMKGRVPHIERENN